MVDEMMGGMDMADRETVNFDPDHWYWQATDGRLYSSRAQALVQESDEDYVAWRHLWLPTPWPKDVAGEQTEAALTEVLEGYGLSLFPATLEEVKDELKAKIDEAAELERLKYITGGAGQAMTYQEKVAQAVSYTKAHLAYVAGLEGTEDGEGEEGAGEPNMAEYPLLAAGLGVDGDTLLEVAETVTFAYAIWSQIGAEIEAMRLLAKANIDAAQTVEEAQTLFEAVVWPNSQMLEDMAEGEEEDGGEDGDGEEEAS